MEFSRSEATLRCAAVDVAIGAGSRGRGYRRGALICETLQLISAYKMSDPEPFIHERVGRHAIFSAHPASTASSSPSSAVPSAAGLQLPFLHDHAPQCMIPKTQLKARHLFICGVFSSTLQSHVASGAASFSSITRIPEFRASDPLTGFPIEKWSDSSSSLSPH